jgi:hypothetical protein
MILCNPKSIFIMILHLVLALALQLKAFPSQLYIWHAHSCLCLHFVVRNNIFRDVTKFGASCLGINNLISDT